MSRDKHLVFSSLFFVATLWLATVASAESALDLPWPKACNKSWAKYRQRLQNLGEKGEKNLSEHISSIDELLQRDTTQDIVSHPTTSTKQSEIDKFRAQGASDLETKRKAALDAHSNPDVSLEEAVRLTDEYEQAAIRFHREIDELLENAPIGAPSTISHVDSLYDATSANFYADAINSFIKKEGSGLNEIQLDSFREQFMTTLIEQGPATAFEEMSELISKSGLELTSPQSKALGVALLNATKSHANRMLELRKNFTEVSIKAFRDGELEYNPSEARNIINDWLSTFHVDQVGIKKLEPYLQQRFDEFRNLVNEIDDPKMKEQLENLLANAENAAARSLDADNQLTTDQLLNLDGWVEATHHHANMHVLNDTLPSEIKTQRQNRGGYKPMTPSTRVREALRRVDDAIDKDEWPKEGKQTHSVFPGWVTREMLNDAINKKRVGHILKNENITGEAQHYSGDNSLLITNPYTGEQARFAADVAYRDGNSGRVRTIIPLEGEGITRVNFAPDGKTPASAEVFTDNQWRQVELPSNEENIFVIPNVLERGGESAFP